MNQAALGALSLTRSASEGEFRERVDRWGFRRWMVFTATPSLALRVSGERIPQKGRHQRFGVMHDGGRRKWLISLELRGTGSAIMC